ncbi:unnamed protein product [Symbiodinium sp. CCMP2592]|nr:unnamed protein product [Symbiodinium sp. CCMP2592]
MARGSPALCTILVVLGACGAFSGSFVTGRLAGCSPPARVEALNRRATDGDSTSRRGFLETITKPSPATAVVAVLTLVIVYVLTREEKARKGKVCVRSQQYLDDYLADPAKVERLAAKGVPYDKMRSYLQDPGCVEFADYWQNLLTARSFWDAGEEYKVG